MTLKMPFVVDEIDLAELLETIQDLMGWTRAGTFDQEEGELEAFERAERILQRYAERKGEADA